MNNNVGNTSNDNVGDIFNDIGSTGSGSQKSLYVKVASVTHE